MTLTTSLSARQIQVKALLLDGLSNEEIGTTLGLHADTVKVYSSAIYQKLGVRGRAGLAAQEIARLRERLGLKHRSREAASGAG